jgi:hypothetical protein
MAHRIRSPLRKLVEKKVSQIRTAQRPQAMARYHDTALQALVAWISCDDLHFGNSNSCSEDWTNDIGIHLPLLRASEERKHAHAHVPTYSLR